MSQIESYRCKRCGQEIVWVRNGIQWVPYNPIGTRHRCTSGHYGR